MFKLEDRSENNSNGQNYNWMMSLIEVSDYYICLTVPERAALQMVQFEIPQVSDIRQKRSFENQEQKELGNLGSETNCKDSKRQNDNENVQKCQQMRSQTILDHEYGEVSSLNEFNFHLNLSIPMIIESQILTLCIIGKMFEMSSPGNPTNEREVMVPQQEFQTSDDQSDRDEEDSIS